MKYQIVPIQAHQIDLISKRIAFFNQLSKHFRQEFIEQKVWMNGWMNELIALVMHLAKHLSYDAHFGYMCVCACACLFTLLMRLKSHFLFYLKILLVFSYTMCKCLRAIG